MIEIKLDFEIVVAEHSGWMLRYIKQKVRNDSLAEDLLQESFLRAFRAYENYVDDGKIKAWLTRIAANVVNNNFTGKNLVFNNVVSLSMDDEDDSEFDIPDPSDAPDLIVTRNDTVSQIMGIINNLNDRDREIMYYRYIYDMSVEDTSKQLGIPLGTVKSRTHNTITKIQKQMGVNIAPITKGVHIMTCKELYKYLFNYAKGTISAENKAFVEKHLADCQECVDIVTALKNLIPHIKYAPDDEMTHFNIRFNGVTYSVIKSEVNPKGSNGFGYNGNSGILGLYDNNGNEIEYEDKLVNPDNNYHRVNIKYNDKTPNPLEQLTAYDGDYDTFSQTKESPNLYKIEYCNYLGNPGYTGLFTAIPKEATNIRIKKGNGVIDCGTYKFVYVRRYAERDEGIHIDATFNM